MSKVSIPSMASWVACSTCSGGSTPGARAFMAYWLEVSSPVGRDLGIYSCRSVAGTNTRSIHSCGRACDFGVPVVSGGHDAAWAFLRRIAPHARTLGVQQIIFARKVWSAIRPASGSVYNGVHPHMDHIHLELTPTASRVLNLTTLRSILGTSKLVDSEDGFMSVLGLDIGEYDDKVLPYDLRVEALQELLNRRGANITVDGKAGPATRTALNRWKTSVGITAASSSGQGKIGAIEYALLHDGGDGTGGVTVSQGDARWVQRGSTVVLP